MMMIKEASFEKTLSKSELGIGIFLALLIGYLHYLFMQYAGGLWRDEVVTAHIAAMPSFADGFRFLKIESFPGFFHFLLHIWHKLGFAESDASVRLFGCLVGLSLLFAYWVVGRPLGYRIPLISSVLIGLSPLAIRTSDCIRAYGIGMTLITLTLGLVWVTLRKPSLKNIILTSLVATLSVQSLYQNAFFLLAICVGAFAVAARHRLWNHALAILSVGMVSALSLLLYAGIMQQLQEFNELVVVPSLTMKRLLDVFSSALSVSGAFMLWVWLALVLIGIIFALRNQFVSKKYEPPTDEQDLQLFAVVTLITAVVGFIVFLKIIDLPTQLWYYIPLMSLVAVLLDTLFATLVKGSGWRALRLAAIAILSIHLFFEAMLGVKVRQTNIDIIANKLTHEAGKNDLIIVAPWYCGTTFARYFHANTAWTTLPPLTDYSLQRLDLFKEQMIANNPIAPVIKQISDTLKSGNRVWIVGDLNAAPEGHVPPELPPAPNSQWGWNHDAYSAIWEMQTLHFIQQHIKNAQLVSVPINQRVSPHENSTLVVLSGWKD